MSAMNEKLTTTGRVTLLLAVATLLGCSDIGITGSVVDEDVSGGDEDIMIALTRGSNSEVYDVMTVDPGYKRAVLAGTDDFLETGRFGDENENRRSDWPFDGDHDIVWGQGLEASWSGLKVVNNAMEGFSPEKFETTPLVARGYLNAAHGERLLGDFYCEVAYGFDHTGGISLDNLGDSEFDNRLVPKDSVFTRMATFAGLALEQAERAVAAGVPNPVGDGLLSDGHFEPQRLVIASHGALAQAHHALASLGVDPGANWDLAVQHASQVPTDFEEVTIADPAVEDNEFWDQSWGNNDPDVNLFSAASDLLPHGFVGTPLTFLFADDPRAEIHDCTTGTGPQGIDCDEEFADDGREIEGIGDIPMWVPLKYPFEGSDDEMVTGTEMRLIEAEEALVNRGNLPEFYDKIDEVRAFRGVDPTDRPGSVGSFEWPNAVDDAMSILDRERYVEMWGEGRRLFDLHRWDHPFITENRAMLPDDKEFFDGGGTRKSCAPVAEVECSINPAIPCP